MAIVNGQLNDPAEVLAMSNIRQVYTGSGFNSAKITASGTDTGTFELDAVASAVDSNYAVVTITGTSDFSWGTNAGGRTKLKAEIKETGGSYGDIVAYMTMIDPWANSGNSGSFSCTWRAVATLTAGQKANGFQIRVNSQSISDSASNSVSWTNVQTVQKLST